MWFTRVSLKNPVFATMVMLALVVLGLFSLQRLQVDQFPNIDFPTVVVIADYPGAAPEIVESEVSRKIEEGVNSIAGISALTSRSYEGQSVVVIEFGLHIDGRKAADDVREKVAAIKPALRAEVKEPRVLRFDPSARAIWSVAVLAEPVDGKPAPSPVELSNWAEQTLKKRLENVRGVGSVALVGATRREINIYLNPQALESFGISPEQVVAAVRNDNQDLPLGAIRSSEQERVIQIAGRLQRPQDFGRIIVARKGGAPVRIEQLARVSDDAQEAESLALYNGQRTLLLNVQKSQDENTIAVVDGLIKTMAAMKDQLPPGVRLEQVTDGSRQIRVSVDNVRRTLIEGALLTVLIVFLFLNSWRSTVITGLTLPIGALLTVLIVFLFLNSWRSTVITGLTLPIALIGSFLFMYMAGFTINMITLMALSLCVGLLIDDAIVVRENIVRHMQMGKSAYQASLDGTEEIGLAVMATTLSIVAVFLPIGFMGGIIGKFFHEFGITIVAAVLISMFVSFTLDPMMSSIWHDPSVLAHGAGAKPGPRSAYDKTIGRVTGWFDQATEALADAYQVVLRWALLHKLLTLGMALLIFIGSVFMVPLLGTEFVPKSDFSETTLSFHTPAGSSLEVTEERARQVEAVVRSFPEVRYTLTTINTGNAQGKMYASMYVRLVDRNARKLGVEQMSVQLRERLRRVPGITVTHVGLTDSVGGQKQISFSIQGAETAELERLARLTLEQVRDIPGLVDLDSTAKPGKPALDIQVNRDVASDLGLNLSQVGNALRTLVAGQTVGNWRAADDQTYDINVRLAPQARNSPQDLDQVPFTVGTQADGSPRIVRLGQLATVRSTIGPNQVNRRDLNREVAISANVSGRSSGEVSADIKKAMDRISLPAGYKFRFGGSTKDMGEAFDYAISALALAVIFIYMILASQFKSFLQPMALMTALPLTLIGVVLALMMFNSTLSMFAIIGVIMLMGLVTKNAILLVDFAIRARADGVDRSAALLLA
ncbi:MAG: efflux RND transporter permease subunit, partial [Burkholderiales bacterium]|nr:efflux RND transporter permease subunit [Burkholderiales bacterium]